MTKKELETKLAELSAAQPATDETAAKPKATKTVKLPAWKAVSSGECIGVSMASGKAYLTFAKRDGKTESPKTSENSRVGVAKPKIISTEAIRYVLDNAEHVRKLADQVDKINA